MNTTRLLTPLLSLVLVANLGATPGDVLVVDHAGTADFTTIQAAVAAAADGDTVLVLPGLYDGFVIDGKSVSVVGDTTLFVDVTSLIRVRNLDTAQDVTLSNLSLSGGLRFNDCTGHIGISDSLLENSGLNFDFGNGDKGSHQIVNCQDVVIARSALIGRDGASVNGPCFVLDGVDGESGVYVDSSNLALYSCEVQGGTGGQAADGSCVFCYNAYSADGGDGIFAKGTSLIYIDDSTTTGGLRGTYTPLCGTIGFDGLDINTLGSAVVENATAPRIRMASETLVRSDLQLNVEVKGPGGASAWVIWSDDSGWRPLGSSIGLLHVDSQSVGLIPLGAIPASGVLSSSLTPPPVLPLMEARRITIQAFTLASTNGRLLGTSTSLDILDPAF